MRPAPTPLRVRPSRRSAADRHTSRQRRAGRVDSRNRAPACARCARERSSTAAQGASGVRISIAAAPSRRVPPDLSHQRALSGTRRAADRAAMLPEKCSPGSVSSAAVAQATRSAGPSCSLFPSPASPECPDWDLPIPRIRSGCTTVSPAPPESLAEPSCVGPQLSSRIPNPRQAQPVAVRGSVDRRSGVPHPRQTAQRRRKSTSLLRLNPSSCRTLLAAPPALHTPTHLPAQPIARPLTSQFHRVAK